jgi:hypothetical protein
MPKHRTPLPPEIKELIQLIRQGRLFEVQQWIKAGKPIRLPEVGHFIISPMLAAMRTGFHSMIEVLLEALKNEADTDHMLYEAVIVVAVLRGKAPGATARFAGIEDANVVSLLDAAQFLADRIEYIERDHEASFRLVGLWVNVVPEHGSAPWSPDSKSGILLARRLGN